MDATKLQPNPEVSANFFSRITFFYAIPFMLLGYRKTVEQADMYQPIPDHNAQNATDNIIRIWKLEIAKAKKAGRKKSLFGAIMRHYIPRAFKLGVLLFIEEGVRVLQPVMIGRLIRYFSPNSPVSTRDAYFSAAVIAITGALCPLIHHPYNYSMQKLGMELKIGVCGIIMHKGLRLSCGALHRTTVGHIITVMSNDVARFDVVFLFINYLWIGPFLLIAYTYLLWYEIGPSCFAGFITLIAFFPFQSFFSRQIGRYRKLIAAQTDKRLSVMDEILSGIRVVKMYAWEDAFASIVGELRRRELHYVRISNIWQSLIMGLFWASTKFTVLSVISVYLFFGNRIDAERVFVTTALFNTCRHPLILYIPFALQYLFESSVSFGRIQRFLELEEFNDLKSPLFIESLNKTGIKPKDGVVGNMNQDSGLTSNPSESEVFIKVKGLSTTWDEISPTKPPVFVVKNVSFSAKAGDLVAVIGPIGAGKSSLLFSLLRETRLVEGSVEIAGTVAYASQEPWLFSGTVRENILFGKPYDEEKYKEVIRVCCLRKDLLQLPSGDMSAVGDQGHSLSGGQKARISLARAIYSDADIYILDDPLSAVDASVGRYLFKTCIAGYLSRKLTVLVTHQVQFLDKATLVLLMQNGETVVSGAFEDIEHLVNFKTTIQETEETYYRQSVGVGKVKRELSELSERGLADNENNDEVFFLAPEEVSPLLDPEKGTELPSELLKKQVSPVRRHRRFSSRSSVFSESSECAIDILLKNPDDQQAMEGFDEDRVVGDVSWSLYLDYLNAMASPPCILIIAFGFAIGVQIFNNTIDWWLNKWSTASEKAALLTPSVAFPPALGVNGTSHQQNATYDDYIDELDFKFFQIRLSLDMYRNAFTVMVLIFTVVSVLRCVWFRLAQVNGSRVLHDRMFKTIVMTPMDFFDRNPIGRILNRFSKDVGTMDDQLSFVFFEFLAGVLQISGTMLVVLFLNPLNFLPFIPLFLLFWFLRQFYLASSRDIKRLEALTRSPLFSHISGVMHGLPVVRSFQNQALAMRKFFYYQDNNTAALYMHLLSSRWFAAVIDWIVALLITVVAFFCIFNKASQQSGEVALMLVYVVQFTGFVSWIMRQSAEVQNGMVSVERIIGYSGLPVEKIGEGIQPPFGWPQYGEILFRHVSLKYSTGSAYVLKNLNFEISPKEKIGIVGRTGAGKSSLLSVLFRLAEPEGLVAIDNIDTKCLPLRDLRKKLSIIPQDPVLFIGSLRRNLDPFGEYTEDRIWDALEQVKLRAYVSELDNGLESTVEEAGSNLSVGQRQLLCLARAVLKHSRILVIDEATANVDPETDRLIQRAIKENFESSTVLTVAHRLHTIMDSDKVMVIDSGCLVEFDHPYKLLCNEDSAFSALVAETGTDTATLLKIMAYNAYASKRLR